eukprot:TRINITY_DN8505_c0_g1_i1.p1 TRINITY_DN8505_c0_g1~~TRINITY_DN8505_c0_g1_i1.p1  ORF type:complete len:177 (-),score=29.41 TRINITY_DN8505_c0_g1_i1:10-540(-)
MERGPSKSLMTNGITRSSTAQYDSTRPMKEILEENKRRAEEQYEIETKLRGPKALDQDEVHFLKAKDDERRLKYLERELDDLAELDRFNNDIRKKVYEVPRDLPEVAPVEPSTEEVKPVVISKKAVMPGVVIVSKKRKNEDNKSSSKGDKAAKKAPEKPKQATNALSSLADYGDSD